MKIEIGIVGAVILAAATAFAAQPVQTNKPAETPSNKLAQLFPDKVVAKGKGFEIKRSKLDEAVSTVKANFVSSGRNVPPSAIPRVEREMLDRLINIELLKARTTDADTAKGKETADKRIAEIKTDPETFEKLNRQLKVTGLTEEEFHKRMIEEAATDVALRRELKTDISDEQAKKFYDDNPAEFEEPEMVRASHVLIGTQDPKTGSELTDEQKKAKKKLAEDILKRARDGEDFAKLAKEFSDDPGSKDKGGEYKFPRGRMVPEFEAAAFALRTNQVSDIVTTQFGYHIIKLSEKLPAKKKSFGESSDDIKKYLETIEMQKKMQPYFEKLKKDADVQIVDEKLKEITLDSGEPGAPVNKPSTK